MLTLTELIDQLLQARRQNSGSSRDLVAVEVPLSDTHYIKSVWVDRRGRVFIEAVEVDRT